MVISKAKAMASLAKCGGSLDEDSARYRSYSIDAPNGYVFGANGEHSYFVGECDGYWVKMPDIWEHLWEVADAGVERCKGKCSRAEDDDHEELHMK